MENMKQYNWLENKTANLKFRSLLYALYLLIRLTALWSSRFRSTLLQKEIAIVMQSKSGAGARTIRCNHGKIRSRKGSDQDAISRITWSSPQAGARVMLKMIKGDSKALVKAVFAKDLLPEGDAAGVKWFLDVTAMLGRIYQKKSGSKFSGVEK
jgi:hypothetical protein